KAYNAICFTKVALFLFVGGLTESAKLSDPGSGNCHVTLMVTNAGNYGIAFDGDGDRVIMVDHEGAGEDRVPPGDQVSDRERAP
ncbi:hypothetical protein ACJEM9_24815, partial [Escherichia coli]